MGWAWMFAGVFVVGFVAGILGMLRVIFRPPWRPKWPASFVERVTHSQKRMEDFYFSRGYRLERVLVVGGFAGCVLSMVLMLTLIFMFGENP